MMRQPSQTRLLLQSRCMRGLLAVLLLWSAAVCVAAETLTIGVATVPHSLPFFVAEHEGYFAQEAPNVRLVDCFPGRKCLDQLLAGTVQFATAADTPIVSSSFVRSDFVVLSTFATSSNDIHVVGAKSAGISTLKQLIGKKIGLIKGSSIDYFFDTVLLFAGIDPARVQKLDVPADQMAQALQQHNIDAFALFDPGLSQALTVLGDSVTVLSTPPIYLSTFNLVTARSLIGKNDADMVKILRVLDRAQQFIKQHPESAQRILQQRLKITRPAGKSINIQIDYMLALDQTFIKTLDVKRAGLVNNKGSKASSRSIILTSSIRCRCFKCGQKP